MPNLTDYDAARAAYRLDLPDTWNFTRDVIDAAAPDRRALVSVAAEGTVRTKTYGDLADESRRLAAALTGQGLGQGDRVLVVHRQAPEWYVVMLACIRAGIVPMPATTLCTARDLAYRIERAEAAGAIVDGDAAAHVDATGLAGTLKVKVCTDDAAGWTPYASLLAAAPDSGGDNATTPDDPLLLYFTSGTVAYPKMVLHEQRYAAAHRMTAYGWQDLTPGDVHWTMSDTGWAKAAWGKLFGQLAIGCTVFERDGRFDPGTTLASIGEHGVTTFCAPPTVYRALIQCDLAAYDLSSLRHCMAAGEPLNPEAMRVWRAATGLDVYDGYGQTETVNVVANLRCLPIRPGSMGKPVPGQDVVVARADGTECDTGEEGVVALRIADGVRPPGLFPGYWRDEEATARAFHHGLYYTGDRATRDADGYLWFVGRDDDVITSAAYRIGPFEVESALLEHPAVAEAAVVGIPDPERTQVVKAYVVLAAGHEPSDALTTGLREHVKRVTAPYKAPKEIEYVDALPKTISGKIRRVELRERG